jgi:hypothetical protein
LDPVSLNATNDRVARLEVELDVIGRRLDRLEHCLTRLPLLCNIIPASGQDVDQLNAIRAALMGDIRQIHREHTLTSKEN